MKKLIIVLISISLGLGAIAKGETEKPSKPMPVLTGQVIDNETGETLTGVMVKVKGSDTCVFTDFDGNFEIQGLEPGKYNLEVSLISYNSNNLKGIKLNGGEQKALKVEMKR